MSDGVVPAIAKFSRPAGWPADVSFVFAQAPLTVSTITLSSKVRHEAVAFLEQAAREVNQVWNFCNATSYRAYYGRYGGTAKWLSAFEMNDLLVGCGEVFGKIGVDIAQAVASEHAARRSQFKKSKLRFRKSGGAKRSLGWIPFKANNLRFGLFDAMGKQVRLKGDPQPVVPAWPKRVDTPELSEAENKAAYAKIRKEFEATREAAEEALLAWEYRKIQAAHTIKLSFMGKTFRLFNGQRLVKAYRLAKQGVGALRSGNFSQDSLGDWYLNVVVDIEEVQLVPLYGEDSFQGLDPGQINALTGSDGRTLRSRRYRDMEPKIAQLQSRGHKKQAKRAHRKAKRQRQDDQAKFVRAAVDDYARHWVGNLSPEKLKQSKLKGQAKSISDSAIGAVTTTLTRIGHRAGRVVEKVNEAFSTRRCSNCQSLSGPTGLDTCVVRAWTCTGCGKRHNRDRNSGVNLSHTGELDWNASSPDDRRTSLPEPRYGRREYILASSPRHRHACGGKTSAQHPTS